MSWVVKYGGSAMTNGKIRRHVASEIRTLADHGQRPLVVHGGGPFIRDALDQSGIRHKRIRGLRVTSPESLKIIEGVITQLGKTLAHEIGGAIGLTGRDAGILRAERFDERLGEVGKMTSVKATALKGLIDAGFIPVLACLALDSNGNILNINADEVAGAVAGAMTSPVIFLTDVPGVLENPLNNNTVVPHLTQRTIGELIEQGVIADGMIPKVEAALAALKQGAPSAVIADGRREDTLNKVIQGKTGTTVTLT
jgi:acetylglutamate kinase